MHVLLQISICKMQHGSCMSPEHMLACCYAAVDTMPASPCCAEHRECCCVGKNRRPLCVTTCRRAWLPPSATWLFPPRSPLHSTGGWYFEWPGPALAGHPLCLSPHIFVLLAAFATLDSERENATENSKQGFVMHMKDKAMKLLRIRT